MSTNLVIKNSNQQHQLKLTAEAVEFDQKTKKRNWKPLRDLYLKPGAYEEVWVGGNQRLIIEEMPT